MNTVELQAKIIADLACCQDSFELANCKAMWRLDAKQGEKEDRSFWTPAKIAIVEELCN